MSRKQHLESNVGNSESKTLILARSWQDFHHYLYSGSCSHRYILANALFLFTIAKVRRMRTEANFYLGTLAVFDIIFLAFGIGSHFMLYFLSPLLQNNYPFESSMGCWPADMDLQLFRSVWLQRANNAGVFGTLLCHMLSITSRYVPRTSKNS